MPSSAFQPVFFGTTISPTAGSSPAARVSTHGAALVAAVIGVVVASTSSEIMITEPWELIRDMLASSLFGQGAGRRVDQLQEGFAAGLDGVAGVAAEDRPQPRAALDAAARGRRHPSLGAGELALLALLGLGDPARAQERWRAPAAARAGAELEKSPVEGCRWAGADRALALGVAARADH